MSDDLVQRLREQSQRQYGWHMAEKSFPPDPDAFHDGCVALDEAADRIEALEAALRKISDYADRRIVIEIARQALDA